MTTNSNPQSCVMPPTNEQSFSKTVDTIVEDLKSKGIFDQFRKECIADVDTKVRFSLRVQLKFILSFVEAWLLESPSKTRRICESIFDSANLGTYRESQSAP